MVDDLIRIGNVELISIADMALNSPAASFFASAPPADLEANLSYFGCDGAFPHPAGCFVVRSSGKTILVDTG